MPVIKNPVRMPGHIGPYRVLEPLGEGGVGDVFLCEQVQPIRRRVAVKMLRQGMDSESALARFRREAQLLAMLDHPDIARVFDVAETGDGLPYFVMEYVSGLPLLEYCNEREFDTGKRVELMIVVCLAVHHVHQKGIVHQDLKPANVLVADLDGKAQPKLIDFGAARSSLHASEPGAAFVASPQYMSPEQADPLFPGVDTRSDIYSLGAMLYELLAGKAPLVPADQVLSLSELQHLFATATPTRPSTAAAAHTDSRVRRRSQEVRGDLDWIVLKALAREPARRYETAADMAADLRRYLERRPIIARPPSRVYEFRKLAQRHALASVFATLIFTTVLAFGGYFSWQAQQLRQERDRVERETASARESTELLITMFSLGDPQAGQNVTVRSALEIGEKHLDANLADQPAARADLLHTMARVYNNIGIPQEAERVSMKVLDEPSIQRQVRSAAERELVRARLAKSAD